MGDVDVVCDREHEKRLSRTVHGNGGSPAAGVRPPHSETGKESTYHATARGDRAGRKGRPLVDRCGVGGYGGQRFCSPGTRPAGDPGPLGASSDATSWGKARGSPTTVGHRHSTRPLPGSRRQLRVPQPDSMGSGHGGRWAGGSQENCSAREYIIQDPPGGQLAGWLRSVRAAQPAAVDRGSANHRNASSTQHGVPVSPPKVCTGASWPTAWSRRGAEEYRVGGMSDGGSYAR